MKCVNVLHINWLVVKYVMAIGESLSDGCLKRHYLSEERMLRIRLSLFRWEWLHCKSRRTKHKIINSTFKTINFYLANFSGNSSDVDRMMAIILQSWNLNKLFPNSQTSASHSNENFIYWHSPEWRWLLIEIPKCLFKIQVLHSDERLQRSQLERPIVK